jgi:hypothetical protein
MDASWFDCLSDKFKWLRMHQHNPDLVVVVNRILDFDEYHDITEVYQSSIWAVCHAYLDYRMGTSFLTADELDYTKGRYGVIGILHMENGNTHIASLRNFLEVYDPGFAFFMMRHHGPPAA